MLLCTVASSANGPFHPRSWPRPACPTWWRWTLMNALEASNPVIVVPICASTSSRVSLRLTMCSMRMAASRLRPLLYAWVLTLRGHGWTVSPQVSIENLARRTQQVYQSETCWSLLRRSYPEAPVQIFVRCNPCSFDVTKQSTNQRLESFHQRWTCSGPMEDVVGSYFVLHCWQLVSLVFLS